MVLGASWKRAANEQFSARDGSVLFWHRPEELVTVVPVGNRHVIVLTDFLQDARPVIRAVVISPE